MHSNIYLSPASRRLGWKFQPARRCLFRGRVHSRTQERREVARQEGFIGNDTLRIGVNGFDDSAVGVSASGQRERDYVPRDSKATASTRTIGETKKVVACNAHCSNDADGSAGKVYSKSSDGAEPRSLDGTRPDSSWGPRNGDSFTREVQVRETLQSGSRPSVRNGSNVRLSKHKSVSLSTSFRSASSSQRLGETGSERASSRTRWPSPAASQARESSSQEAVRDGTFQVGAEVSVSDSAGVSVSVPRGHYIPVARKELWRLLRGCVPEEEWASSARIFAQLELIFSAEVNQQAELATLTLELCNSASVLPTEVHMDGSELHGSGSSADEGDSAGLSQSVDNGKVGGELEALAGLLQSTTDTTSPLEAGSSGAGSASKETEGEAAAAGEREIESAGSRQGARSLGHEQGQSPVDTERICQEINELATALGVTGAASAVASRAKDAVAAAADIVGPVEALPVAEVAAAGSPRWHASGVTPGAEQIADLGETVQWFAGRVQHGPLTHLEAQQLDALFMKQLLTLARQGHFEGLVPRDVALAKSLNDDTTSQLYVKVAPDTLDAAMVAAAVHPELADDSRGVLVMARGHGSETRRGLQLVPKLDYLQLRAVEWVRDAAGAAWRGFVSALKDLSELTGTQAPAPVANALNAAEPVVDEEMWNTVRSRGKEAIVAMSEWGVSPRMFGGGLLITLSDLGLIPKVDVIKLKRFDAVWPSGDHSPVRLRRVALQDIFRRHESNTSSLAQRLLAPATLQEPTFEELLVVFRRRTGLEGGVMQGIKRLKARVRRAANRISRGHIPLVDPAEVAAQRTRGPERREPIQLRILSDIPIAYWRAVFPDKLLQFKPLDGLRLDLITVIGAAAVLAQVKVTNPLLEVVSLISIAVAVVRSVLGYQRMLMRYENFVNDMIASKTLAQEGAVLDTLAAGSAAQRFACAAIAYAILARRAAHARDVIVTLAEARNAAALAVGDGMASAAMRIAAPVATHPWLLEHLPDGEAGPDGGARSRESTAVTGAEAGVLLQEAQELLVRVGGSLSSVEKLAAERPGVAPSEMQAEGDELLTGAGGLRARFNVRTALEDLYRLGLLQEERVAVRGWLQHAGLLATAATENCYATEVPPLVDFLDDDLRLVLVDHTVAEQQMKSTWAALLEASTSASLATIT